MKRVLYLTRYYHSPQQAAGLRAQRFAGALADAGISVHVVTLGKMCEEDTLGSNLTVHSISDEEVKRAANILRPLDPNSPYQYVADLHSDPPGPDADPGMNIAFHECAVSLASQMQIDIIFATGPPFGLLAVGKDIADVLKVPYVTELRDAWYTGMQWPYRNRRTRRAAQQWEDRCLRDAARVIVVTDEVKKILIERYGPEMELKTAVVRHGYAPPYKKRGLTSFFHMVYTGQLRGIDIAAKTFTSKTLQASWQLILRSVAGAKFCERLQLEWMSPHILLEAVGRLAKSNRDFAEKFRLVFAGQAFEEVDRWVRQWGLEHNVEQMGLVPAERAEQLSADADVMVLSLYGIKDCDYHWCVPSKVYAYLGSGNAILGLLPPGEAADLITRAGTGVVAAPDDVAAIAGRIETLFKAWQKGEPLSRPDWKYIQSFELGRQQQLFVESILAVHREYNKATE
jgi:glycosyltransferase involved in cell wall biosynthesis